MFVIAGLPPALHTRAVNSLNAAQRGQAAVIGSPSTERDHALYSTPQIETLIRAVAGFAIRRRVHGPSQPITPSAITLLYVPSRDEEKLLSAFDFAIMPEPLSSLATYGGDGRQLRHNFAEVEAALLAATLATGSAKQKLDIVKERLGRLCDGEAFLLPPHNFHTPEGRLSEKFRELRQNGRPWTDRFEDLTREDFTNEQLKRLQAGQTRRAFVDARLIAYLTAHLTAYHGETRELDGTPTQSDFMLALRSLYRFGAILPYGFHHDAQLADGTAFHNFEFDCAKDERVRVWATHANIYANEFIRAAIKKKI